jgi:hypothetical protein
MLEIEPKDLHEIAANIEAVEALGHEARRFSRAVLNEAECHEPDGATAEATGLLRRSNRFGREGGGDGAVAQIKERNGHRPG